MASKLAANLLLIGTAQFLMLLIAAEAIYPDYSVSKNAISDLGVGNTASIFNLSVAFFGICAMVSACFLFKSGSRRVLCSLLFLAGLGAAGVGVFPETTGAPHFISALISFLFGALCAAYFGASEKSPLSRFSILLGAISLAALFFAASRSFYFGLGAGGMERMVVYPILIWCLAFSGFLLSKGGSGAKMRRG